MKNIKHSLFSAAGVGAIGIMLCACSSVPKPDLPDGSQRIPVNTLASVQQYQEHLENQQIDPIDRQTLQNQIEAMKQEIATLKQFLVSQGKRDDKRPDKTPVVPKLRLTSAADSISPTLPANKYRTPRKGAKGSQTYASATGMRARLDKVKYSDHGVARQLRTPNSHPSTKADRYKGTATADIKLVMNRREP